MKYFLDTNICIYFLKGMYPSIRHAIQRLEPESIKIPAIVKAELLYGAEKSNIKKEINTKIHAFLQPYEIIPFDNESSAHYANIRYSLENKGHVIGPNDLVVASTVCAHGGVLVTNNTKEFKRVPQLQLENWVS